MYLYLMRAQQTDPYEAPVDMANTGIQDDMLPEDHAFFPTEFLDEFYKAGKRIKGFVDVDCVDGMVVSCTWNEERYQAYLLAHGLTDEVPEDAPVEFNAEEEIAKLKQENKQLTAKLTAAIESNAMLEECIVEMAGIVYA